MEDTDNKSISSRRRKHNSLRNRIYRKRKRNKGVAGEPQTLDIGECADGDQSASKKVKSTDCHCTENELVMNGKDNDPKIDLHISQFGTANREDFNSPSQEQNRESQQQGLLLLQQETARISNHFNLSGQLPTPLRTLVPAPTQIEQCMADEN